MYTPSLDNLDLYQEEPDVTADAVCPEIFKDKKKRDELAQWLANLLDAGVSQQKSRHARWDRNKRLYDNDPPARSYAPYKGHANEHYGIIQPKLDALAGMVVGTVTSKEPYCRAIRWEQDQEVGQTEKFVEDKIHEHVTKANGKLQFKKGAVTAGWCNAGHIIVERDDMGVRLTHKSPYDTIVYPATVDKIEDARLYAYRFYLDEDEIEEKKKEGDYFKDAVTAIKDPTSNAREAMPGVQSPQQNIPVEGVGQVPLWKVVFKKGEKTYAATVHKECSSIMRIWEYEYETPCMCKLSYKVASEDGYYTAGSVANDLQGPQLTINELWNMLVDGLRKSVFPTLAVPGMLANDTMDMRLSEGDIVPVPGLDRGVSFLAQVNVQPLMIAIGELERHADTVARVSQAAAAGQFKKGATATEVGSVMQGQAEARDDYIETFSMGVEMVYAHVHEILKKGNIVPGLPEISEVKWSAVSTSPAATPEIIISLLKEVYGLAQDPRSGIDIHSLIKEMLTSISRLGVANVTNLQHDNPLNGQPALPDPMGGMGTPPSDPLLAGLMGQSPGSDQSGLPEFQG